MIFDLMLLTKVAEICESRTLTPKNLPKVAWQAPCFARFYVLHCLSQFLVLIQMPDHGLLHLDSNWHGTAVASAVGTNAVAQIAEIE